MSQKTTVAIGALIAVACALGAFLWLHARRGQPLPDVVIAEPPGFHAATPENRPASPPRKKPGTVADSSSKKVVPAPPVETGLQLKAGEELDYTANVSKLSNVATLSLKIAGKGNLLSKNV